MNKDGKKLVVLIGNKKEFRFLHIMLERQGYLAVSCTPHEARKYLIEEGGSVDALVYDIQNNFGLNHKEVHSSVVKFTPICPNAKILVYGKMEYKDFFVGLERVFFLENQTIFLLPLRLDGDIKKILPLE